MNLSPAFPTVDAEAVVVAPIFSYLEGMAITIGISDGQIARTRSGFANFFVFYARPKLMRLADRRLEALRAYAELACGLFPRSVPTISLDDAGFDGSQSRALLAMIGIEEDERHLQE